MFEIIAVVVMMAAGLAGAMVASTAPDAPPAKAVAREATPRAEPAPADAPTGQFTTAAEVRPILEATRTSWVAVRNFNGQDLLYFTHLEAWRCGLQEIRFSINSAAATRVWLAEPCYADTPQPNAVRMTERLPYIALPPGSITSVTVAIVYDDGVEVIETFDRAEIEIP